MLFSAAKITGHIMTCDGGKSLTSRGQQDWYGWQYMSRKFEQESTSFYNYKLYREKVTAPPRNNLDQLEDWVEDNQDSKWAMKGNELHSKYMTMYTNQLEEKNHMTHLMQAHETGALANPKVA